MKPLQVAVVGFGRVGQVCAELISMSHDLSLAAIVRRAMSVGEKLPEQLRRIPVTTRINQTGDVHAALICVPTNAVRETASETLQHGIPIVECARFHGDALYAHKDAIHKLAIHHRVPAIVGAGWDPGALSVFRLWLALLTPGGVTETHHRAGISLHHATMARSVTGVKDALCTELRASDGKFRRYVYVELEKGADPDTITQAIRADPLFLGEDTQVFPVECLAALGQEGRGVVLDRRGPPGRLGHQHLLLEARFELSVMAAQVMLAAVRAVTQLEPGAHFLTEIPLSSIWGEKMDKAHRDWL
jgi:diaminopimelate dehydrogenase